MSFWSALWARPERLSRLSRYTIGNGVLYMIVGAVLFVLPEPLLELSFMAPLDGYDTGLSHALGMSVFFIGWFYVMGGRTGAASFGLCTIVDRAIVPFLLLGLVWSEQIAPMMGLPLAILDPALAIGAYLVWRSERSDAISSS